MSNPDLAVIMRRMGALAAASVLPAGALLLSAGHARWAAALCFGAAVAAVNAAMLAWRINRTAVGPAEQALRVMHQGMGIRFAMILLSAVVVVRVDPSATPAFLVGLTTTMALAIAVAARAVFQPATASAPRRVWFGRRAVADRQNSV